MDQLPLFTPRHLSVQATLGCDTVALGDVAPRQKITLFTGAEDGTDHFTTVVTQGWRYTCAATGAALVVCPEGNYQGTPWMIVHQPSGYPLLAGARPHLLGWDFDRQGDLCRSPEGLRAIALLLSKLGISRGLNRKKVDALRELFLQAGIGENSD